VIFIDFECLKGTRGEAPQPMLLGVLVGDDDEHLQQLIVDERLEPARVARRDRTIYVPIAEAVGTLVAMAVAEDTRIVGWSFFDRDRLVDARPDLASEITERYVNALLIAKPWRQKIYPAVKIEREDPYAPKHTLDKYAILAGYPAVGAFRRATPARWIRHMVDQLESSGGRYRRTTKQAKRDWRTLLDYNRHDCLALRHIAVKASHELAAWRAYERTRFCVDEGKRRVCFMAGSTNRGLQALLDRHTATRWAFITAWNPGAVSKPIEENDRHQTQLRRAVTRYTVLPGEGLGPDESWEPEESLMVLGISESDAVRLGREFGQLAIVVGKRGEASRLVSCSKVPRRWPQSAVTSGQSRS
jgi:hypothetical protein